MRSLANDLAKDIKSSIGRLIKKGVFPEFNLPSFDLRPPRYAEYGDFACNIALQITKKVKRDPLTIANTISEEMNHKCDWSTTTVAAPGFLNFKVQDEFILNQLKDILKKKEEYFLLEIGKGLSAQVEFVSANPTGPLTIGRTRGAVIGDTMARILVAAGYSVEREYYFNNAGNQMVNLGNSLRARYKQALGKAEEIPNEDEEWFYQGDYLIDFAKQLINEHGDSLKKESWLTFTNYAEQQMFEWIRASLNSINISHDVYYNEQSLYENEAVWETLSEIESAGYTYRSAHRESEKTTTKELLPATWLRSSLLEENVEDQILVRSNGEPTYTLTDIAYHRDKFARGFDLMINVLGVDHQSEVRVVKSGMRALGVLPDRLKVLFHQMVRAVVDGVEMKMSTRRGVFDTLDDLVAKTSADAIRYHMLARSPHSHLDFDVERVVQQGNENPVYYIQNAHVRCAGIYREAIQRGLNVEGADLTLLGSIELNFLRKALAIGDQIEQVIVRMAPHRIAFFALDLASAFHPVYEQIRVMEENIDEETAKARLAFYVGVQQIFKALLDLMGMSAPERM